MILLLPVMIFFSALAEASGSGRTLSIFMLGDSDTRRKITRTLLVQPTALAAVMGEVQQLEAALFDLRRDVVGCRAPGNSWPCRFPFCLSGLGDSELTLGFAPNSF